MSIHQNEKGAGMKKVPDKKKSKLLPSPCHVGGWHCLLPCSPIIKVPGKKNFFAPFRVFRGPI